MLCFFCYTPFGQNNDPEKSAVRFSSAASHLQTFNFSDHVLPHFSFIRCPPTYFPWKAAYFKFCSKHNLKQSLGLNFPYL